MGGVAEKISSLFGIKNDNSDPLKSQLSQSTLPATWRSEEEQQRISVSAQASRGVPMVINEVFERKIFSFDTNDYEAVPKGTGSGVLIDDRRGIIITNSHVIDRASRVTIEFEGQKVEATILADYPTLDIALLRVKNVPSGMVSIPLGDSSSLVAGQSVIAIGSPFGLENTVTAGVISNPRRIVSDDKRPPIEMIQTDAAVNPGNSGGPLINMNGELVGVNRMIVSGGSGAFAGITFAVPVDAIKQMLREAIDRGLLNPKIGISFADTKFGPIVASVVGDSPAAKAKIIGYDELKRRGISEGEGLFIVSKINGQPVKSSQEIYTAISASKPDSPMRIEFTVGSKLRKSYSVILKPEPL